MSRPRGHPGDVRFAELRPHPPGLVRIDPDGDVEPAVGVGAAGEHLGMAMQPAHAGAVTDLERNLKATVLGTPDRFDVLDAAGQVVASDAFGRPGLREAC